MDYVDSLHEYGLAGAPSSQLSSLVPNCTALELQLQQLGLKNETSDTTSEDESDVSASAPMNDRELLNILLKGCTSAIVKTVDSVDDVNEELYCTDSKNTVRSSSRAFQRLSGRGWLGGVVLLLASYPKPT